MPSLLSRGPMFMIHVACGTIGGYVTLSASNRNRSFADTLSGVNAFSRDLQIQMFRCKKDSNDRYGDGRSHVEVS
jgi:hypothetical protein